MSKGNKYDTGKLRFSLFPPNALWAIIEVLEHGARKYGDFNWTLLDDPETRYLNAMQRHIRDRSTSPRDRDSGLMHSAHVACNAVFLLWFDLTQVAQATEDTFLKRFANEVPSDNLLIQDNDPTRPMTNRPKRNAQSWRREDV